MFARFPVFLRSSDAAAVILALLLVYAMAGFQVPDSSSLSVYPVMAETTDSAPVTIQV